ncbi:hypothetical protein M8J77_006498 [Diaphorina citri]|nr:hypothetical protein M8J77_006498 [Diaphorina citri]
MSATHSSNVKHTLHCNESYGTSNLKNSWKIVTDETNKVSFIANLNDDKSGNTSKVVEKIKIFFYQAFLPQGFPDTVSNDYIEYQLWDTAQAFCSTLTAVLTTHAIMQGVGVGNESATTLAAATAWIIKDGTGMIGRILFAWWEGTILDADCKRWRILADLINDVAMCVELMLPLFPQSCVIYALALSSLGKSLVGVAGGATRASIIQHQAAHSGNIGDIAAKDGSQETCVNLTASLLGLVVLKLCTENIFLTWLLFIIFTGLHIYFNYRAVRCLEFNTFNRQRFIILFQHYLHSKHILSPSQVRVQERILFPLTEKQAFNMNITLGASVLNVQPQSSVCVNKYRQWFILCKKSKPSNAVSVLLNINADVKATLKAYCYAVFHDVKKNVSPSLSLFQKEIKYENDEEEFKQTYFEEFYNKLIGSQQWDLSYLNHFQIDEWRYHDASVTVEKQKMN